MSREAGRYVDEFETALNKKDFEKIRQLIDDHRKELDQVGVSKKREKPFFRMIFNRYMKTNDYDYIEFLNSIDLPQETPPDLAKGKVLRAAAAASKESVKPFRDFLHDLLEREPYDFYFYLRTATADEINAADMRSYNLLQSLLWDLFDNRKHDSLGLYRLIIPLIANVPGLSYAHRDKDNHTALHIAARLCDRNKNGGEDEFSQLMKNELFPVLLKAAVASGFDFSTPGGRGEPLLYRIAERGSVENLKQVLKHSQDQIDFVGMSGTTALGIAIYNENFDVANVLLEAGANPFLGAPDKTPQSLINMKREIAKSYPPAKRDQLLRALDDLQQRLPHPARKINPIQRASVSEEENQPDRDFEAVLNGKDFDAVLGMIRDQEDTLYASRFQIIFNKFLETRDDNIIDFLNKVNPPLKRPPALKDKPATEQPTVKMFRSELLNDPYALYFYLRTATPEELNQLDTGGDNLLQFFLKQNIETDLCKVIIPLIANAPGMDFSHANKDKLTALHLAAYQCVNEKRSEDSYTRAMKEEIFPKILNAAVASGFDFNTPGPRGEPVLYRIAERGSYDNVQQVLGHSMEQINFMGQSGTSALAIAIFRDNFGAANALLEAGADPRIGRSGKKPMDIIRRKVESSDYTTDQKKQLKELADRIKIHDASQAKSEAKGQQRSLFFSKSPAHIEKVNELIKKRPYWNPTDEQRKERAAFEALKYRFEQPDVDLKEALDDWKEDGHFELKKSFFGSETEVVQVSELINSDKIKGEINELYESIGEDLPYSIVTEAPSSPRPGLLGVEEDDEL